MFITSLTYIEYSINITSWCSHCHFSFCVHVCVWVGCMSVQCMCIPVNVQRPEGDTRYPALSFYSLSSWDKVSHWNGNSASGHYISAILLSLFFPRMGLQECMWSHSGFCKFAETKLRCSCLFNKLLYLLSPLSSPSIVISRYTLYRPELLTRPGHLNEPPKQLTVAEGNCFRI